MDYGSMRNFKEDQLAQMQPGQPATIVADTLPSHVFHGHVLSLAPAIAVAGLEMSEISSANWIKSLVPFVVICFGGFMALLDIQIVASSLQNIGGGLSAAQDEISWVQTAY
jgi:hypothetical protein